MLKETILNDLKAAMKSKDHEKRDTLRFLLSEIKNKEIDKRDSLNDDEIYLLIAKSIKSRKDSILQFQKGEREDLVEKEEKQIEIINKYLPQQLSEAEIKTEVREILDRENIDSPKGIGIVMKELMAKFKGRIDGKQAKEIVEDLLSNKLNT